MSAPIWNGAQWVQDLKAMKANEKERERLAKSEERRAKAFAANFNNWHKNTGRRIH